MKILKRRIHFKFTIFLISHLLEGTRGWKKTQIEAQNQEKCIPLTNCYFILCLNVFMHINKEAFLILRFFLNARYILFILLLTLLIFIVANIITLP